MTTLNDIIWAAQTYENTNYNSSYLTVMRNEAFLTTIRNAPENLQIAEVRGIIIKFLNKWLCRLRNYDDTTASNMKQCLVDIHQDLVAIQDYSILNFENDTNRERIERIFNRFWFYGSTIAKNFGPTCTSKILHIINPALFTMWDDAIRTHYWSINNNITDAGRGYYYFLIESKLIAEGLVNEFAPYNLGELSFWLSERLHIMPPLSLAKFIDEHNFLSYTKQLTRAPNWVNPFL